MDLKLTAKEGIEKIRQIFSSMAPAPVVPPVAPVVEQTFQDYPLPDGSVLSIDKLEVGGSVLQNGAPAADGVITLGDGTEITIAGGLISEIKPKAEEQQPSAEELMKAQIEGLANQLAASEKKFSELEAFATSQKEANEKILETMEKFLAFEVATPVQPEIDLSKLSRLERRRLYKQG